MTGSAGHLVLGGEAVTGCSGHPQGADQGHLQANVDAVETTNCEDSECNESPPTMCTPTSPV